MLGHLIVRIQIGETATALLGYDKLTQQIAMDAGAWRVALCLTWDFLMPRVLSAMGVPMDLTH